ncbi:MAG: hypothetical protein KH208_01480 [Desulfovibrio sp.]|uniref:hypothetical protein n=1 Tax=Desulfovibrio sp. TaxID=885 RepID=UPI0025BB0EF6|nr:hypothetical protein [Desulfovibrio sp.]MBS6828531.1 hypothetical protein [Desulfovibrio sp.]
MDKDDMASEGRTTTAPLNNTFCAAYRQELRRRIFFEGNAWISGKTEQAGRGHR